MSLKYSFLSFFIVLVCLPITAQNKECKHRPKRFPSPFVHMTSDYTRMAFQTDVLLKGYFQTETTLSLSPFQRSENSKGMYAYNAYNIRVGLGKQIEVYSALYFPIGPLPENEDWPGYMSVPVLLGFKFNLLPESSTTPGLSVLLGYNYNPGKPYAHFDFILDKFFFNSLKTSFSFGPRIYAGRTSDVEYTLGIQIKERYKTTGIYLMASNTYVYLDDIVHVGLIFTDNLNYTCTLGYGVQENDGLIVGSLSWLFHARTLGRKIRANHNSRSI